MKAISYLQVSEYRLFYFFQEESIKPVIIQEISYDGNDKVKTTVKDKMEKFN